MRALLPAACGEVDLAAAYAYPSGPWVRANMIAGVDGAAVLDGGSRGLGSPADRELLGTLRALADVVLVGAATARAEGYRPLRPKPARRAARVAAGLPPSPRLAVVSGSLDLDPAGPLFEPSDAPTLVVTCAAAPASRLRALGSVAEVVTAGDDKVELAVAVDALCRLGLVHVLCEGGPSLLGQLAAASRLDELCLTVSPLLVAGESPRILDGPTVRDRAQLTGVLQDGDHLFLRYLLSPHRR